MTRLPLIVQSERRKRIGLALIVWLQMCIVSSWFLVTLDVLFKKAEPTVVNSTDPK
ncbi:hypothetical protein Gotur_018572 [Gossypium turneri]